jgi:hypothetical protein
MSGNLSGQNEEQSKVLRRVSAAAYLPSVFNADGVHKSPPTVFARLLLLPEMIDYSLLHVYYLRCARKCPF